ncbi:imidazole glycerol phosphate synthase subunit HisF [Phaeospirillum tilakii]|uniref:Imidazole glycerol phosphate synthase subunit HisF n=1 Tax=Phaeospirillum tilakii TaxID=741673 RepID=A0ABW5CG79_9PROT
MLPVRIIARLDIKGGNVVKGIRMEGLRVVGKPGDLARAYYDDGIDEIIFIDTVASLYGRDNIVGVVEQAARDVFVPLTAGGGVRTVDDIKCLLRSGADKVAVNTEAIKRPTFLSEAANIFGQQCMVLSVHAKRHPGGWEAFTDNGREPTGRDVLEWVAEAESLGAGEILLTSVDRDGVKRGFDTDLIAAVRQKVRVPVIASSGAGSADHVLGALRSGGTDAVACASLFHYRLCPIPKLKEQLAMAGLAVRR